MSESKQAFENLMRKRRIQPSEWWVYWEFWKAGAAWQRKQQERK